MDTLSLPADRRETEVGNYFISNYPPYSTWSASEIPEFLLALDRPPRHEPLSLYVHLPFCSQRCHYCLYRVYARRSQDDVDRYVDALLRELEMYVEHPAFAKRQPTSVYFGGGSPTYLGSRQLQRLIAGLRARISWRQVQECTVECEPRTTTPEKLAALREGGVSRLSLGFQSLDDSVLQEVGRDQTRADSLAAFRDARGAGFDEINVDLLAGLPGQTDASWDATIEETLSLEPDCITIYQLELTHNSGLFARQRHGALDDLPDWPTKRHRVARAFAACEAAGYTIGSGYMAIRDPSRWRFVYTVESFWHGADLIGLGESSFGHVSGVHYQNTDRFEDYVEALEAQRLPLRRAHRLSPEESLRRELVLHLKTGALDLAYFRSKFGVELRNAYAAEFDLLARKGLGELDVGAFRLTREGLLRVDELLETFYLPEHCGIRYT